MRFEFATAGRIIFGFGTSREVAPRAAEMAGRAFIVTGSTGQRAAPLLEELGKQGIDCVTFNVPGEPTAALVKEAAKLARRARSDLVIAVGGGSVLDTGKAAAALLTNRGELEDYLEVVGEGRPLDKKPAPWIAVPTTAGTGAEATCNAVIALPEHKVKVSLRHPWMLPLLAVIDPGLSLTMPARLTAHTGLDALTQLIEAYLSNKANPLTDCICREGIALAGRSLRVAYEDGGNRRAREEMALASLLSGMALANAKLGAVHGIAGPLGGMVSAPHGAICAKLLPLVMESNLQALRKRKPESPALDRFTEIARILNGDPSARAQEAVIFVQELCKALNIPPLAAFGLEEHDFPALVAQSRKSSSMQGNPVRLTEEELTEILEKSI